jgi:hypothetical protein
MAAQRPRRARIAVKRMRLEGNDAIVTAVRAGA